MSVKSKTLAAINGRVESRRAGATTKEIRETLEARYHPFVLTRCCELFGISNIRKANPDRLWHMLYGLTWAESYNRTIEEYLARWPDAPGTILMPKPGSAS